jgi:hypothetical protein
MSAALMSDRQVMELSPVGIALRRAGKVAMRGVDSESL